MKRVSSARRALVALMAMVAALALAPTAPASAADREPVVFVHGYGGIGGDWGPAQSVFKDAGYQQSELYTFDYNSYGSNVLNANSLAQFVDKVRQETGAEKVDIVNHSMGGLVTMYYLTQLGGTAKVDQVASIAGANHGTTFSATCIVFMTCQEMFPGSAFIRGITRGDETPGPTTYATWYSPCDGIIYPYTSTRQDGATNNLVACQTHLGFLSDRSVLQDISRFLG